MKGEDKTGGQPIRELEELRQKVAYLETCLDLRKRAEEALRTSEMQLEATKDYLDNIIKSSADAIVVVDMDGRVRSWNKAAEGYMGYTAAEVLGKSNRTFFADPDEADRILERLLRAGELKNYRTIAISKDKKPVHISMSAALLRDKNGVPIGTVRVSRDITKEVELERKIKEERDNLNLIFDNMVDGVYIVSKDYRVEFMNKVLIDEFGDQVGGICYAVFHNRDEPCPLCKHTEVLNGKTVRWEWHSRRKNKTSDLIETPLKNIDGSLSKLTIFRDITARRQAEEEINKLLATIETAKEAINITSADGRITYTNDAMDKLFGYEKGGLIGKHASILNAGPTPEEMTKGIIETIRRGGYWEGEIYNKRKDGAEFISYARISARKDEDGRIIQYLSTQHDITERKKMEESLRQSETEYRALFETTGHAKAIIEEDMTISRINKEFELISGYSKAEMEGKKKWTDFVAKEDIERVTEYHRLRLVNQKAVPRSYEFCYTTKKGELRNGFVTVDLIPGTKKSIASIVDITGRKQAEEALRETRDYLENLFKYANAPIIVWDPSFTITRFNHAFEHLTGRSAAEVMGKPLDILFPEDKREEAMTLIRRALAGERWETVEIPILRADGTVKIVLWNSATLYAADGTTPIATIAQGHDITDRKYAEEALQSAHMKMRAIFDAIREPMNVVDLDFNLIEVNDALIKTYGPPDKESVIGHKCFEVLKGRKDICPNCAVAEVYRTKSPTYRITTPEDEISTEERSFEIFAYPIMNEHGDLYGAVELTRDITDRKQTEEQIKASLREKEILLREIHHRVKNNLQIISTLLYLQSNYIKDKKAFDMFKDSQNRIKSMALIHDKLYRFKDLGKIDIAGYIRDLTTDLFHAYGVDPDGIKLKINVYEVLLGVNTAIPCGLMINELVSNALKHAFPDGKEGEIRIELTRSVGEKRFTLIVSDNGIGFPGDLDFRNTKTLGLQLVITLVDQLNGTIELDRRSGTEFKITFAEQ
jgi:PAS domain S-box-containing protein